jgi:hypothetical protein
MIYGIYQWNSNAYNIKDDFPFSMGRREIKKIRNVI